MKKADRWYPISSVAGQRNVRALGWKLSRSRKDPSAERAVDAQRVRWHAAPEERPRDIPQKPSAPLPCATFPRTRIKDSSYQRVGPRLA